MAAGQVTPEQEQQLENQAEADESETEDDSWLQQMEQFRKHPLNLNRAEEADLRELRILSDLQIGSFLRYRQLLGALLSVYELQAVPAWDAATIKKLLPYVTVKDDRSLMQNLGERFRGGDHTVLVRSSQVLEKARGFLLDSGNNYLGSPQRLFVRYTYNYKNLLQFGLSGDKDAGEELFKGSRKTGFDFYSFHLFARKLGLVQSLALGDFTVNMGQGLIQWQSLAFKKSADVLNIKRQAAVLRPYNSAGEFFFHRGAGITLGRRNWELTLFGSYRKLDANFNTDTLATTDDFVSSILNSGYHRNKAELADRQALTQVAWGGTLAFRGAGWRLALNGIRYHFDLPIQKSAEPYNLYAISGRNWGNYSMDYSYTWRNLHFFGEAAMDYRSYTALLNGLLLSLDSRVDASLVYRHISPGYQSFFTNAFTENSFPTNERGLYAGISIRPAQGWRLDAYADLFMFPWLRFRVDAPGRGSDYLAQLTYKPDKKLEIYTRFRAESKQINYSGTEQPGRPIVFTPRKNWRTQLSFKASDNFTIRNRFEIMWFDKKGPQAAQGYLGYADVLYKPLLSRISGGLRLQYFETEGFNARIYAYENDVLYYFAIPVFFDRGFRYYINLNYDVNKRISLWLKWGQTVYHNKSETGSGLDLIEGNRRSELRLQGLFRL